MTLTSIAWDDSPLDVNPDGISLFTPEQVFDANPRVLGSASTGTEILALAEANAVPEPSSLALLALGATGVITRRQRKKNS